jgi:hypothetical protein
MLAPSDLFAHVVGDVETHIPGGPPPVPRFWYASSPYVLPEVPAPIWVDLGVMAQQVSLWTGLSNRQLATALGTTHPTVHRLLTTTSEASWVRNVEYRRRLREVDTIVRRVLELVGRDLERVHVLLRQPVQGVTALDHLMAGRPERAYLAVLGALRPRQESLLVGRRPQLPGANTVPVLDDD